MANALLESHWTKLLKAHPSFEDPGLANALKGYAKADGKDVDERLAVLAKVVSLAEEAKKLSIKSRNKDVTSYLDEVLTEADAERQRLENQDEDAAGVLNDEKAYGAYLKKSLKRLQKGPLNFAAALGRKPADHKMVFHKAQDGKKLLKTLREATNLGKFAWGIAGGHAEQPTTLTLGLEGPQIGGLKEKLEQFLKYYKPLPFDTILLMVDGEIVEDLPDPDDVTSTTGAPTPPAPDPESVRFAQRLRQLKTNLDKVIAGGVVVSLELQKLYAEAAQAFKQQDYATAHATLDKLPALIAKGLEQLAASALGDGDPQTHFNDRLKALLPGIKAAAGTAAGEPAKLKASEAGTFARKQDFAKANLLLDEVEAVLSGKGGGEEKTSQPVSAGFVQLWDRALSAWESAIGTVDGQLERLRVALLQEDDPELKRIAEFGLNAVTGDHKVPLQAAIMEVKLAGKQVSPKVIAKAQAMVEEFQDHINTDDQVEACDVNPFEVKVAIRETLGPALAEMDQALRRAFA